MPDCPAVVQTRIGPKPGFTASILQDLRCVIVLSETQTATRGGTSPGFAHDTEKLPHLHCVFCSKLCSPDFPNERAKRLRTGNVTVVPQHMQGRCFGNCEPPVHDQPTSEAHDQISTRPGETVNSSFVFIYRTSQFVEHRFLFWWQHTSQTHKNYDLATQHHLWVGRDQTYAFCHSSVRCTSRRYDACFGRRCNWRPQVMQRSVALNGHVLVKQHISHLNQSCFDVTACIVFN